jgi:hypothetical protein
LAVPEQQFQDIIEQIEQTVTETINKTLKQLQLPTSDNFDPLVFRLQIVQDIEQKLDEFKKQLVVSPSLPVVRQQASAQEKQWFEYFPFSFFFKKVEQ